MRRGPLRTWSVVGLAAAVTLASVLDGAFGSGELVDSPLALLVAAVAGFLLGAWTRPAVAVAGVLASTAALTFANQRHFAGDFPLADDLAFFLIVLGAPAVAGASLVARVAQVRDLADLSIRLAALRRDEVAAARLEEQHRIELAVHHRLVEQMGAIALCAEGARHVADGATRSRALEQVEATARAGLDELRLALGLLREDAEDPGTGQSAPIIRAAPPTSRADLLLAAGMGAAMAVESVVSGESRGDAWANVVAAVLVAAPLVVRRRHPVSALGAVIALAALVSSVLTPLPEMVTAIALLLLASYSVGAHARGWWPAVGLVIAWLGALVIGLASPAGTRDPEGLLPTMVWSALAVVAGLLAAGWSGRAVRMREVVAELEEGRDLDVRVGVARQRREMARDLHDSVAHALTVVCLNAGAARRAPDTQSDGALDVIAAASRRGMGEVRRGLDALEPDDALHPPSLQAMARRLGVDLHLDLHERVDLRAEQAALVHRVLREAVVNAARHAPGARVDARLEVTTGRVRLEVVDNGGTSVPVRLGAGTGLSGLATLLHDRGGDLDYGPQPGGGFRLEATLPLSADVPA